MRVALPAESYREPRGGRRFLSAADGTSAPAARRRGCGRGALAATRLDDRRLRPDGRGLQPPPGTRRRETGRSSPTATWRRWASGSSAGRGITPADTSEGMLVALDQRGDGAPILAGPRSDRRAVADRRRPEPRPWVTVVGIVGNVRHNGLTDPSKRSSTFRTPSGTSRLGNADPRHEPRDQELVVLRPR